MSLGALWGGQKGPTTHTTDLGNVHPWTPWDTTATVAGWTSRIPFNPFSRNQARSFTRARRPPGQEWMQAAGVCAYIAIAITSINVIFILIAVGIGYSKPHTARSFSRLQLYHGHCNRTSHWATAIHIVINLFSTALLAASSHAMQCVGAPTREDVDWEHKHRRWLDIGVVSWRNFRIMNPKRKILWLLLLLSSTPIHMLYNSVVYASIVTYNYAMILVPSDLTPTESLVNANHTEAFYTTVGSTPETILTEIFNGTFTRMTNEECLDNYDVQYNTQLSTLIFVADRQFFHNESSMSAMMDYYGTIYDYTNDQGSDQAEAAIANNNWTAQGLSWKYFSAPYINDTHYDVSEIPISHCLAKRATQRCELLFSPSIALAVIVSNIIKVTCMFLAARIDRPGILLRVGDAVASFLNQPDITTQGRCLLSRKDMKRGPDPWEKSRGRGGIFRRGIRFLRLRKGTDIPLEDLNNESDQETTPKAAFEKLPSPKRWFQAASWTRWTMTFLLFSICIAGPSWFYRALVRLGEWSLEDQWYLGMGSPNYETNFSFGTDNILVLVLLTNWPQLVLSILYFVCKNLLSCMLVTAEYNDYAMQRKPLRVSWPRGSQRSSYYLSLPARYSVPLLVMSAVLHWLLTESLYPVDWNVYSVFGEVDYDDSPNGCGFSPLAILLTLILLGVSLCALLILGARQFKSSMPLAAHCSAAISAACHPPVGDEDAAFKPVMWGEVVHFHHQTHPVPEGPAIGHCTFTSQAVVTPSLSRVYK
ncbi:uncharacterized protein BP01DRAFT_388378 [Aspergillus saccharolyticus JOP 1030-1]|uniref:DUF6536 domain-containing protein n=1 Tax=Aspergillus saccharolyticus JOP 1030-1 TaxID=1450539 RepID=A0A318ZRU5_9EURO|nr:hypothetical protein BP01DRAFT_388378 [Aspergillus saccharolyticus JOP 1030-1]PYH49324.1 hypothetical protein BP01DRAFT_388378 [Aspergillus saccharolyticus JOP 1030-1]